MYFKLLLSEEENKELEEKAKKLAWIRQLI